MVQEKEEKEQQMQMLMVALEAKGRSLIERKSISAKIRRAYCKKLAQLKIIPFFKDPPHPNGERSPREPFKLSYLLFHLQQEEEDSLRGKLRPYNLYQMCQIPPNP